MSAVVVATDFGGPEVLAVIDEPAREPGPHEVRLAVRAIGVNPVDFKSYSGAFGADPALLPKRLGSEASGVVDAVGPDVTGIGVGDEVIAFRAPGAYAERLVVTDQAITPKPRSLPWEQAAGLMLTGATATHALVAADVQPGETVLIHGAAGGVGLITVQLARARHSTVIATASERNHGLLRELGAVPVVYGPGLADRVRAAAPQGVDAALDLIGTDEAVDVSLELVANRKRIVSIAAFARGQRDGITLIGGGPGADPGTELRDAARAQLAAAAGDGTLRVVVHMTFPLADAADAHRELMTGHVTGKVVLTV
jgi:NADPH:quinone reductase-like Zn-dependent oxidoreductase